MKAYTVKDVARLLDVPPGQVRSFARTGLLEPERGPRGELRFSFQDLVVLRTTKGLVDSKVPQRKLRRVLEKLREQLPSGRPLCGVHIAAHGDRIVVRDGASTWSPEDGQALFDFEVADLARAVAPHARQAVDEADTRPQALTADEWFALGCDLEAAAPEHARDAYRRALEGDPQHVDARINLGRLLQESRRHEAAEKHYRLALLFRPDDATALYNLGVCLQDRQQIDEAVRAYSAAIEADPGCADAYYNLACLYEKLGDEAAALRHLQTYRKLTREP